jgi:uncharacterized protein YgbK (DUF1537 family)
MPPHADRYQGIPLAIVADDLTGACDSIAPFAAPCAPMPVLLRATAPPLDDRGIWAIDLDVRDAGPAQAASAVRRALEPRIPEQRVFLKVDSAGRGQIGAMVSGALAAGARAVLISPAFPRRGSTVVHGSVHVGAEGVAVDLTALGSPSAERDDAPLLIGAATVAQGPERLVKVVSDAVRDGVRRVVVDADCDRCLRSIVIAWLRLRDVALAGSGGATRALADLAREVSPHEPTPAGRTPPDAGQDDAVLVVSASPSPAAIAQLAVLEARCGAALVRFDPVEQGANVPAPSAARVLVCATASSSVDRDDGERARVVARTAAAWAAERRSIVGVVLVGGATARAFLDETGADRLDVEGELAAGIPHGIVRGGWMAGIRFVTKAGRFGDADTLTRAVDHVLGRSA